MPQWFIVLEAAGWDPLRAQDMEERLTQAWWERYRVFRKEREAVDEWEQQRKS